MPTDAPTAFFSYSREDSEFAIRLAEDLKAAGAVVWIDQLDIAPGQEWDNAIEDAVTQCPRMLLILTAASVKSKKVRNEIAFALDEEKTIIPVLCQDCMVPLQLRRIQHIDFRTDYARGLKALLKTLGAEQQAAAENARLEQEERKWLVIAGEVQAEKARLEEERKQAAEQARLEEERKLAAAEEARFKNISARLEQQERELSTAAEKARLEQQERLHLEQQRSGAPMPSPAIVSPALKKIALTACGILVAALILYWATRPKQPQVATQTPPVQTQPSGPPPSAEVSSGSAAAGQGAEVKQQATESLSAQAMKEKGDDYYFGRNAVSKDYKQAVNWYRKAAEAGDAPGMNNLGFMYEQGYGVKQDYQQAVSWYRKAAEAGNAAGMTSLGFMYHNGWGVDRDYNQAVTWYRKSAEAGNAAAMANLGNAYRDGNGVTRDYSQSVSWYRKAAEAGNAVGMDGLGRMYETGRGVDIDYPQAVTWYRKAAEADNANGMNNLGNM